MDIQKLNDYLDSISTNQEVLISVEFAKKKRGIINSPQIAYELKHQIVNMLVTYVKKELSENNIVNYQAMGALDGEIECINVNEVISDEINELDRCFVININDEKKFDWGNVDYYVVEIESQGQKLRLYRQFQKMKRLRKGMLLQFFHDELIRMESDFIGIDEMVDIVEFDDEFLIFNHIALERIFGYKDLFEKKTTEAVNLLKEKDVFANIEEFQEACMRDRRILKRFTNIMQNGRLPLFFENIDKVPGLVKELGLHIKFDSDGKLVYSSKEQLYEITNLMSDAYFRSLLANRIGVAKLEGTLEE